MTYQQQIKHFLITLQSVIQNKSVVNFFGVRYIIYGNVVKRLSR